MQVISFTSLMPLLSIFLFCCTSQTLRASLLNVWPMNQQQWPPLEAGWKGKILGSISKFSESALNMILRWFTHTLKWEKHYSVPAKSSQSCSTLCDPMDCSLWGSSVHGILQAKILGWVAMPFSREPSPGIEPKRSFTSPALAAGFFTTSATWETQIFAGWCSIFLL